MKLLTTTGPFDQARGLVSVLDAACDAFEEIVMVIGGPPGRQRLAGRAVPAGGHAGRGRPGRR